MLRSATTMLSTASAIPEKAAKTGPLAQIKRRCEISGLMNQVGEVPLGDLEEADLIPDCTDADSPPPALRQAREVWGGGWGARRKPRVHAGGSTPPPDLPLKGEEAYQFPVQHNFQPFDAATWSRFRQTWRALAFTSCRHRSISAGSTPSVIEPKWKCWAGCIAKPCSI
jgi:hypothetical protein